MPPQLALLLTVLFIGCLLLRDSKEEPRVSGAIWIPIFYLMIIGSPQVAQWLDGGGTCRFSEGMDPGFSKHFPPECPLVCLALSVSAYVDAVQSSVLSS